MVYDFDAAKIPFPLKGLTCNIRGVGRRTNPGPFTFVPLPATSAIPFSNASFLHILSRDSVVGLDRAFPFSSYFHYIFAYIIYVSSSLNLTNQRICSMALDGFEFSPRFLFLFVTRSTLIQGNRAHVQKRSSRNLFVGF